MLGWILGAFSLHARSGLVGELGRASRALAGLNRYLSEILKQNAGTAGGCHFSSFWQLSFSAPLSIASWLHRIFKLASYYWALIGNSLPPPAPTSLGLLGSLRCVGW